MERTPTKDEQIIALEDAYRRLKREHLMTQIALVSASGGEIRVHPDHLHDARQMTLHRWTEPADGSVTFKVERTAR